MSRFGDYDGDSDYVNGGDLWTARARNALRGKRGRKALAELREALAALPEKRLIEGALCSVGARAKAEAMPEMVVLPWYSPDPVVNHDRERLMEFVAEQGEGVCAIGAYVWHQRVKAGATPEEAFAAIAMQSPDDEDGHSTATAGEAAGLTWTLAWELADRNDEAFGSMTPEQRYDAFLAFIEEQLAMPPLAAAPRRVKPVRQSKQATPARHGRKIGALPESWL